MSVTPLSDAYLMANRSKFPNSSLPILQNKLRNLPSERQELLHSIPLKDPVVTLILSLLLGGLG